MKIYTEVQKHFNKLIVGTVLLGDKDQVYMMSGSELETQDIDQAHIHGIKRAMCFVRNNKPLYAEEDVTLYTSVHFQQRYDSEHFEEKLANDEYINRFLQERGIKAIHNKEEFNEFDKQKLMVANHQVRYVNHNNYVGKNTIKGR